MKILVIGQGIAGTMLAWSLQKRHADIHIFEGELSGSASPVAAGIINPVTGKRFVKSWRFDAFFPAAKSAYREVEKELKISVFEEKNIVRLLATPEEANDWGARCILPDYADFLSETDDAGAWQGLIRPGFRFGLIRQAARVEFAPLISAFRQKAISEGVFFQKQLDYAEIEKLTNEYAAVVFCEGWHGRENPFFPDLPWQVAKGEALLIQFLDKKPLEVGEMLKKTMTLVPQGDGLFWAGASYQWHFDDLKPSDGEKNFILHHLQEMLAAPFEIVGHTAGVRPTVKDRRPFIGQSIVHPKIFIFNGLGTKGALLAPYWAEHLAVHLLEGKPLDGEVDVRRTSKSV